MPMATEIVGSWFPTGYYGHFRSKSRNDFVCEYRNLAKPQPPDKFINRAVQPCSKHAFSMHDNRNSFMTDALYFEQGLGKRRNSTKSAKFNADFYTWMPHKAEIERSRPQVSTYQLDFTKNGVKQLLVKRPKTSFDGAPVITTYRYAHGDAAPNRDEIQRISARAVQLTAQSRLQRAKTAKPGCRETVASCLSWYRPKAPSATPVTDYSNMQHIPAPPQTAPPTLQESVPAPCPEPVEA